MQNMFSKEFRKNRFRCLASGRGFGGLSEETLNSNLIAVTADSKEA